MLSTRLNILGAALFLLALASMGISLLIPSDQEETFYLSVLFVFMAFCCIGFAKQLRRRRN